MAIELTPEVERLLVARAEQRGLTPHEVAEEILSDWLRQLNNAPEVEATNNDDEQ